MRYDGCACRYSNKSALKDIEARRAAGLREVSSGAASPQPSDEKPTALVKSGINSDGLFLWESHLDGLEEDSALERIACVGIVFALQRLCRQFVQVLGYALYDSSVGLTLSTWTAV